MDSSVFEVAVGTFSGAAAAFALEILRRYRKSVNENANKGNRVLFRLKQNWNTMAQIQRDVIDPIREVEGRGVLMQRVQEYELHDRIEMSDLDFLIDRGFPQLVFDVLLEDERYRTNIRALNERSSLYRHEIQIPLGNANVSEGTPLTKDRLVCIVGERQFVEVSRLTESIICNIDSSIDSTMEIQPELRAKLLYTCPGKSFLKFEAKK